MVLAEQNNLIADPIIKQSLASDINLSNIPSSNSSDLREFGMNIYNIEKFFVTGQYYEIKKYTNICSPVIELILNKSINSHLFFQDNAIIKHFLNNCTGIIDCPKLISQIFKHASLTIIHEFINNSYTVYENEIITKLFEDYLIKLIKKTKTNNRTNEINYWLENYHNFNKCRCIIEVVLVNLTFEDVKIFLEKGAPVIITKVIEEFLIKIIRTKVNPDNNDKDDVMKIFKYFLNNCNDFSNCTNLIQTLIRYHMIDTAKELIKRKAKLIITEDFSRFITQLIIDSRAVKWYEDRTEILFFIFSQDTDFSKCQNLSYNICRYTNKELVSYLVEKKIIVLPNEKFGSLIIDIIIKRTDDTTELLLYLLDFCDMNTLKLISPPIFKNSPKIIIEHLLSKNILSRTDTNQSPLLIILNRGETTENLEILDYVLKTNKFILDYEYRTEYTYEKSLNYATKNCSDLTVNLLLNYVTKSPYKEKILNFGDCDYSLLNLLEVLKTPLQYAKRNPKITEKCVQRIVDMGGQTYSNCIIM